jgi:bifunctional DNA-binding transcriptional regulator/antitoxin component of YhaV-PrlF toxin-antitoxin module
MKTITTQERTGRVGQRRQVVIPREILEILKLQAGDLVAFAEQIREANARLDAESSER